MRVSYLSAAVIASAALFTPLQTLAGEGKYICAVAEARECLPLQVCKRVSPRQINIAPLMELDLDKKELVSAAMGDRNRKETIEGIRKTKDALYLHGQQDEETWSAVISLVDGAMTASISAADAGFVLFGNCASR